MRRGLVVTTVIGVLLGIPGGAGGDAPTEGSNAPPIKPSCVTPKRVQSITFSASKYPHIRSHMLRALKKGWPSILVVNRPQDGERRARLLHNIPTKAGYDRDEYPPAVGRGRPNGNLRGLVQGENPTGWKADVEYVASHENRSQGSVMGSKLRRFCDGTRFRYVWR